ncbi:MAG: acetyl-CoA carboxylase biotin carboxyl carrier protein [Simkaniaceae bacterium]|nr:acetyl-CoA carboxylase biotin carboxyl carrier protein [Candidatus Sacchlamyda saccharinae]
MDNKQIKEMMAAMEKAGLKRIRIKDEKGFELELERHVEAHHLPPPKHHEPHHHFAPPPPPPRAGTEPAPEAAKPGDFVSSPMVGTYYSAPSPDDPLYVKVGDTVEEETVVCIIEAMKVMNEVKAGKKGKIVEILVNNADPVEFGTHLFRIE